MFLSHGTVWSCFLSSPFSLSLYLSVLCAFVSSALSGIGPSTVRTLIERDLLRDPLSLLQLAEQRGQLLELDGFGERRVDNLLKRIQKALLLADVWPRLLFGLGIPHVGLRTARLLAQHYPSPAALYTAIDLTVGTAEQDVESSTAQPLNEIPTVGVTLLSTLKEYFVINANRNHLDQLWRLTRD
jgi:DNA ligase (NAD+)